MHTIAAIDAIDAIDPLRWTMTRKLISVRATPNEAGEAGAGVETIAKSTYTFFTGGWIQSHRAYAAYHRTNFWTAALWLFYVSRMAGCGMVVQVSLGAVGRGLACHSLLMTSQHSGAARYAMPYIQDKFASKGVLRS